MADYESKLLTINLKKFHGARVIEAYDEDDNLERGIFIPIDRNDLCVDKKKNVLLFGYVNVNHKYPNEESYQILHSTSPKFYKKMKELGYGRLVIGNIRKPKNGYIWRPRETFVTQYIVQNSNKAK